MPNLPKVKRAVVLIGVQHAKNLTKLQAVWEGVADMEEWALSQGVESDLIVKITDEDGEVSAARIQEPIVKLINRSDLEQIIIYFSGHGFIKGTDEFWMLSDGVANTIGSVNVSLSVEVARQSSIPHVVFISDACRTIVNTLALQLISGFSVFPIPQMSATNEKFIDQFYATSLGTAALEIPEGDSGEYKAVYTAALVEALRGQHPNALDQKDGISFVRPHKLKKFLTKHVVKELGASGPSQKPQARITSEPEAWISAVDLSGAINESPPVFGDQDFGLLIDGEMSDLISMSELSAGKVLADKDFDVAKILEVASQSKPLNNRAEFAGISKANRQFSDSISRTAEPFGPASIDTNSGFKIRGATVKACLAAGEIYEIRDGGQLVSCEVASWSAASVLLTLHNGTGVLMPAIGDFLATLTFEGESLVDVAYEPSEGSSRWHMYESKADELRTLRAVVAASSRLGVFQLEGPDAENLAKRMQVSKGIDPSLALYAAHAYRDQGQRERIKQMANYLMQDLNFIPFDIALLANRLDLGKHGNIIPCLPMLSQTWTILPAYPYEFPEGLELISRHVLPHSLWTVFDAEGVELISQAIKEGKIK